MVRLDGRPASVGSLHRLAQAMTAPGLQPAVDRATDGPVGLVALDFSIRAAPVTSVRPDWMMAADVRLDRAIDLEAIPGLALSHGPTFADRLWGDFAVAVWDHGRSRLLLSRDPAGARPLYWCMQPGRWFAFASLPKGLHRSGLASPAPDPAAFAFSALFDRLPPRRTWFEQIGEVYPGHTLVLDLARADPLQVQHWFPPAARGRPWKNGRPEAALELRERVRAAVESRLPAGKAVACELSGGLDSTSVAILAARAMARRGGRVLTLSHVDPIRDDLPILDDRRHLLRTLNQEPNFDAFLTYVDGAVGADDPDVPQAIASARFGLMFEHVRSAGLDLILTGNGGDEAASYNGNDVILALLRRGRCFYALREMHRRARREAVGLRALVRFNVLDPVRSSQSAFRGAASPRASKESAAEHFLTSEALHLAHALANLGQTRISPASRLLEGPNFERCTYHAVLAANHGVAFTHPLLDRSVLEFALRLPPEYLLDDGRIREPFRRAMMGVLPEDVRLSHHKYGVKLGDLPALGERKAQALRWLDDARADNLMSRLFNLDAVRQAVHEIPEGDAAIALARDLARRNVRPRRLPTGLEASLRVARLARQATRLAKAAASASSVDPLA
jgi:asparagine synthase (glutamine-hydrolysing)